MMQAAAAPFNPNQQPKPSEESEPSTAASEDKPKQSSMTSNLCIKHFPEPIIYMSEEAGPLCKKCIPEHLESKKDREEEKDEEAIKKLQKQTEILQSMFG